MQSTFPAPLCEASLTKPDSRPFSQQTFCHSRKRRKNVLLTFLRAAFCITKVLVAYWLCFIQVFQFSHDGVIASQHSKTKDPKKTQLHQIKKSITSLFTPVCFSTSFLSLKMSSKEKVERVLVI